MPKGVLFHQQTQDNDLPPALGASAFDAWTSGFSPLSSAANAPFGGSSFTSSFTSSAHRVSVERADKGKGLRLHSWPKID